LQNHLSRFHRRRIGHAHPTHEGGLETEFVDELRDLRTAAMNDDRIDSDQIEQNDILREGFGQFRRSHRMAAVFDDEGLAAKAPYIR
jgi:hypothetical protein